MINRNNLIENFIKTCFKQGHSKDKTTEIAAVFISKLDTELIEKAKTDFWSFVQCMQAHNEEYSFLSLSEKWEFIVIKAFQKITDSYEIDRAIFNLTPRLGKTTLITELGQAFWIGRKNFKNATINANFEKINEINEKVKKIVNSEIFQKIFAIQDKAKKNATKKIILSNNSTSSFKVSGSNVIGSGYNGIIFDDYLNPNNQRSKAKKDQAKMNLSSFFSRKQYAKKDNEQNTKLVVVEQRLALDDTTATCKKQWDEFNIPYIHIILPFYFEEDTEIEGYTFKKGEYVDSRFNNNIKNEILSERGEYIFKTQYQQQPSDPQDMVIKKDWLKFYSCNYLDLEIKQTFITTDMAFTKSDYADNTVFALWGIGSNGILYCLDIEILQDVYSVTREVLLQFIAKYKNLKFQNKEYITLSSVLIEAVPASQPLIADIKDTEHRYLVEELKRDADKVARVHGSIGFLQSNKLHLPINNKKTSQIIEEMTEFRSDDSHLHDDIVDNICDAIDYTKNKSFLYSVVEL